MSHDFSGNAGTLLDECALLYESTIKSVHEAAQDQDRRAYGGMVRSIKGAMVESLAHKLLRSAWALLGRNNDEIKYNLHKKYEIPIRQEYVDKIADDDLRREIQENIGKYKIKHGTDIHVYDSDEFILSVECKAYSENAMLKRILFDAFLLKTKFPNLKFAMVQLENQLGGDYASKDPGKMLGSYQSHTLMSYMDSVDLHIITLLDGDRKVHCPIHKPEFYKPLRRERLEQAAIYLAELIDQ